MDTLGSADMMRQMALVVVLQSASPSLFLFLSGRKNPITVHLRK